VSGDVYQIAARGGWRNDAVWVTEDYELARELAKAFHEPMPRVVAHAVMTDTGNTAGHAVAWCGDVTLHLRTCARLPVPFESDRRMPVPSPLTVFERRGLRRASHRPQWSKTWETRMQITVQENTGGPETLRLTERPEPIPGVGETLIRSAPAGIQPGRCCGPLRRTQADR
jgi:hypothetical protein